MSSDMATGHYYHTERKPLYIGQKFGRLTVFARGLTRTTTNNKRQFFYFCKCSCGSFKSINKQSLVNHETQSCGCKRIENATKARRLIKGMAAAHATFDTTKRNAKRRKINWSLTFEQFYQISQQPCHYCGNLPQQRTQRQYHGAFVHNGLDRLNSKKGYIKNNIVSCCKYCNYAKNDLSKSDFLNHVKKIYEYNHR